MWRIFLACSRLFDCLFHCFLFSVWAQKIDRNIIGKQDVNFPARLQLKKKKKISVDMVGAYW